MRVFVFHLMPWPYLPPDFGDTHDSAWVVCENELYDPERGHEVYNRYLDELELAEHHGRLPRAPDEARQAGHPGQRPDALRPPAARGRGAGDARRRQRWAGD